MIRQLPPQTRGEHRALLYMSEPLVMLSLQLNKLILSDTHKVTIRLTSGKRKE